MTKKTDTAAQAAHAPFDAATFAGMQERMQDLEKKNATLLSLVEQLTGAKAGPGSGVVPRGVKPAELGEPPRVLETHKLLFIGQRLNQQEGVPEPDLYPSPDGLVYVCGLGGSPVVFRGTHDDERAHAMVHRSFGDWLITEDRRRDSNGRPMGARYAWADPLPPAEEA